MASRISIKQKQEHRLVAVWLKPELLAKIDARANGNRSKFIREALEAYIFFGNVHKRS